MGLRISNPQAYVPSGPTTMPKLNFDPTTFLSISAGIQGLGAIGGAYAQAQAQKSQADYQRRMFEVNSRLADFQAQDAKDRGDVGAAQAIKRGDQMQSTQRAAAGGSGVDVNSGSARDIQADTQAISALDALTIKNNAMREAFGYKSQAISYSGQGQMVQIAGNAESWNTLATGGMRALGYGVDAGYFAAGGGRNTYRGTSG